MAIIQSGLDSSLATVDSNGSIYTTIYPNKVIGAYQWSATSGAIAASTAANSVLFTFKNSGTNIIVLKRVSVGLQITTAYTKGSLRLATYFARTSFTQGTTNATAITLTGNNGKKRTSFPTTTATGYICTTTGITGDTATGEDTIPFSTIGIDLTAAISNSPAAGLVELFSQQATEYPVVLAAGEGFRLKNDTAFALTGVSNLIVNLEYAEVASY